MVQTHVHIVEFLGCELSLISFSWGWDHVVSWSAEEVVVGQIVGGGLYQRVKLGAKGNWGLGWAGK